MRKYLLIMAVVFGLAVAIGGIWGAHWLLTWDDLPAKAKPDGFTRIAHRWECSDKGGGCLFASHGKGCGDYNYYCYHDWVYVSNDLNYEETIVALANRYTEAGWMVRGCGPGEFAPVDPSDPCGLGAIRRAPETGRWVECFWYSDFKTRDKWREEWRREFQSQVDESTSAILVTTSCG